MDGLKAQPDSLLSARHAAASQARAGHLRGVRAGRGEPGRMEASQRQPHPRPPVGAGEAQLTAGGLFNTGRRRITNCKLKKKIKK